MESSVSTKKEAIYDLFTSKEGRLIARMILVREQFKLMGLRAWTRIFIEYFPQYNDHKMFVAAKNVWAGRSTDESITQDFERMIENLKSE